MDSSCIVNQFGDGGDDDDQQITSHSLGGVKSGGVIGCCLVLVKARDPRVVVWRKMGNWMVEMR